MRFPHPATNAAPTREHAHLVFSWCNRIQVFWIDASWIAAPMVYLKTIRYLALIQDMRHPMRPFANPAIVNLAIAILVSICRPKPTARIWFWNATILEALAQGAGAFPHSYPRRYVRFDHRCLYLADADEAEMQRTCNGNCVRASGECGDDIGLIANPA